MSKLIETPANGGLTAQQEAWAQEFARTRNQRQAYRAAYAVGNMSSKTLGKRAQEVFNTPEVKARVAELIADAAAPVGVTIGWVVAKLKAIVDADPNELMTVKTGACRYCHGEDHKYHWRVREYDEAMEKTDRLNEEAQKLAAVTHLPPKDHPYPDPGGGFDYDATRAPHPNCPDCDGEGLTRVLVQDTDLLSPNARALYAGVKTTTNGLEIKTYDQSKALELLGKVVGAFKDDSPKTLQVELKGMVAAVQVEATDPRQAALMYQDMILGKG